MAGPPKVEIIETTRFGILPNYLKILTLVFTAAGISLAVFYMFGFTFRGQVLLNIAYYYLLFSLFFPFAFILLPARKGNKQIQWYDLLAAVLAFGIPFYFFLHAWEIVNVGWIPASPLNFTLGLIFILLALEGGRRSAGPIR